MTRFVQSIAPLPDVYAADFALHAHLDRLLGDAAFDEVVDGR